MNDNRKRVEDPEDRVRWRKRICCDDSCREEKKGKEEE